MNAADFGKVAVLMGGNSAERAISLKSGSAVLAALQARGVNAHQIDPDFNVIQKLKADSFDRVFLCLHGRGGEDGVIQGALEQSGIPYTGSGVMGSAIGMDKYRCKLLWQGARLPTPPFAILLSEKDLLDAEKIGFPLMIKPAREGSSIGMAKVENAGTLREAWENARRYDKLVIAERWITGKEYTCGLLQNQALPMIRLETPRTFYDYEAKYNLDTTQYHCPCGLESSVEAKFQDLAVTAFEVVGGSGWGRVDMLTDMDGNPWLIEVNTAPGMTDHSLVPMAARACGINFEELVWRVLHTSLRS